jgi:hypothetical protein
LATNGDAAAAAAAPVARRLWVWRRQGDVHKNRFFKIKVVIKVEYPSPKS